MEWIYFGTDVTQISDIHRQFGQRPLRTFPLSNILRHKIYLRYISGIRVVRPLNYVPYNKDEAMQLLQERSAGSRIRRSTSSRASRSSTKATGCRRSSATTRARCSSRA